MYLTYLNAASFRNVINFETTYIHTTKNSEIKKYEETKTAKTFQITIGFLNIIKLFS